MSHISPLKKLFRRQKALAGLPKIMDDLEGKRPPDVLLSVPPLYLMMRRKDFETHGESIAQIVHETWGESE